jgi:phosphocarrier protein HPr
MERRVAVAATEGLHARPAALFTRAAAGTGIPVTLGKPGGPRVDARSILGVLSLDVRHGDEVVLSADGVGAEAVLEQLAALLAGAAVVHSGDADG